nr:MAG TPA: hypothetical protein [Caudoviricetes sp.]
MVTAGTAGQHPANGNPPTLAGCQQQRTCHYGQIWT